MAMQGNDTAKVAIVGFGPRGLGAVEALAAAIPSSLQPLKVDIFEPFATPGAGPNFDPVESPLCRLNIPIRDIDIRGATDGGCGSFADWLGDRGDDPDAFPPRADLGRYLKARFDDLLKHESLSLDLRPLRIDAVERGKDGWQLRAEDQVFGPYREVLLTLGQPAVQPDDQMAEWQDHAKQSDGVLTGAYPAHILAKSAEGWPGRTVAIRGLALSAFDVFRVLTVAQGGTFRDGKYIPSGREPALILPFSLDGRAPFPKPETEAIDALYEPGDAETQTFLEAMCDASAADVARARNLINEALVPVATRILDKTGGTGDVADWLQKEWSSPGTQEDGDTTEALMQGIAMAEGRVPPSVGYVIGQVWRKWQDQVRQGYNPTKTPADTVELLIGFDEGLKRYSYGPPVSSSRELVALIEAGIVDPAWSADPEIKTVERGWRLTSGGREVTADFMIDAVLPSPDLAIVTATLITGLISHGRLTQVKDGLGAKIAADGTVIGACGERSAGLSFLGRLALGSVIAADSLHDCFGEASHRWADGAARRLETGRDSADR